MDLSALGQSGKKYGLIIKKDQKPASALKPSVFSIDSDDDKDEKTVVMKRLNEAKNKMVKMKVQLDIEKALEEDPNCFDYDEVYDQDHKKIEEEAVAVKKDLKPKYISGLVKAAESRKKRYEIITEKKVQKERDAEGDKYDDKECFVSNTYKEKLKERKEAEERDRRQEVLEELMDARGEKDYTGFYRNILEQRVGQNKLIEDESVKENCIDAPPSTKEKSYSPEIDDRRQVRQKTRGSDDDSPRRHKRRRSRSRTPRKHRGRRSESSGSEDGRHFKRSRHDRRSPRRNDDYKDRHERHDKKERKRSSPDRDLRRRSVERKKDKEEVEVNEVKEEASQIVDKKAKRNVGDSLDDAKARYLARKAGNAIKPIISKK